MNARRVSDASIATLTRSCDPAAAFVLPRRAAGSQPRRLRGGGVQHGVDARIQRRAVHPVDARRAQLLPALLFRRVQRLAAQLQALQAEGRDLRLRSGESKGEG